MALNKKHTVLAPVFSLIWWDMQSHLQNASPAEMMAIPVVKVETGRTI